jgi:hypothetical protein
VRREGYCRQTADEQERTAPHHRRSPGVVAPRRVSTRLPQQRLGSPFKGQRPLPNVA